MKAKESAQLSNTSDKERIRKYLIGLLYDLYLMQNIQENMIEAAITESAISQIEIIFYDLIGETVPSKQEVLRNIN